MTPAEAYRASLASQHPDRHAPESCPCKDGHYGPGPEDCDFGCVRCGRQVSVLTGLCDLCDPRLAPDAPLPPEVVAACEAARATAEPDAKQHPPSASEADLLREVDADG